MTATPDWVARPYGPARADLSPDYQWDQLPQEQVRGISQRLNESVMQNMVQAIRGLFVPTGRTGGAFDQLTEWAQDLFDALTDHTDVITENTEAITRLEDVIPAMNTTAAYVGDLQDMVTAPRVLLNTMGGNTGTPVDILANMTCADTSHSHTRRGCPIFIPQEGPLGVSTGTIYFTPIVVDRNGTVDKMRWIVGADAALNSINYYEMALMVFNPEYNPDTGFTGGLEKVWGSGNIKDAEADTTTLAEVEIAMGIDQVCTPGQILFVAHQQVSPGVFQNPRSFAAVPQAGIARPTSLAPLDSSCLTTNGPYSQGIPSSIDTATLLRENRFIPWAGVSVNAPTL